MQVIRVRPAVPRQYSVVPLALCMYRRHAVYFLLSLTVQGAESRDMIATQASSLCCIVHAGCCEHASTFRVYEGRDRHHQQDSKGVARVMMQIDEIDFGRSRLHCAWSASATEAELLKARHLVL